MHELVLGGCKSGKSRCAERRAADWLASPGRSACLLATALPLDAEMRERIARHRQDRAARLPSVSAIEVPRPLPQVLRDMSAEHRMVMVDCLTLWLTNLMMPMEGEPIGDDAWAQQQADLVDALRGARGPVVLVSNEIGLGVMPMGREARRFLDALGLLHQRVAEACARVTLMVAGHELAVKGRP
ncbi:bifunctional adenosylcobinamide kinase/adenosylcobinamide-phosphate guanylyltransferase [Piscinibacter terrae]|uniref:Bifunctional adenosylcobalamin biosynthesis protein n=1 Tax=Piscinibacter terrae TaxID=2496871 RepID=A0A3N7K6N0_9BURK|nr:bifunctional adenosylcobinamide kinase/adenosylcobinamide-phosphate guanylyltransferase [Albitalea terrae]RQP26535.1 bifunctional adenosylcobinamide kinase/adenosylcobinamide-phosphate guanylyltransferase [Albitalea terrae]